MAMTKELGVNHISDKCPHLLGKHGETIGYSSHIDIFEKHLSTSQKSNMAVETCGNSSLKALIIFAFHFFTLIKIAELAMFADFGLQKRSDSARNYPVVFASKFLPTLARWSRSSFHHALRRSCERLGSCDIYFLHTPIHPLPLEFWISCACEAAKVAGHLTLMLKHQYQIWKKLLKGSHFKGFILSGNASMNIYETRTYMFSSPFIIIHRFNFIRKS